MNLYEGIKHNLQESDVDYRAILNRLYRYINYEYNEIGSDDRSFLNNIISRGLRTDEDIEYERERKRQARIDAKLKKDKEEHLEKLRNYRKENGITTYSLRGKKRDVLDSLKSNLGSDYFVKEPGIDGVLTIKKNDSNFGIRAYLQNKNLPDDVFGLVFEPVISKKISPRMQPIYDLSAGDYDVEIGKDKFKGKKYKLVDIPKLADTIKQVLSVEEE